MEKQEKDQQTKQRPIIEKEPYEAPKATLY